MDKSIKIRYIALYYSVSFYVGLATSILGPSLLSFIDQTNSTIKSLSIIFPVRAGFYMIGSWLAGLLFDRMKGHKLLLLGTAIAGLSLGFVPSVSGSLGLVLLMMSLGSASGLIDVGCNTLLFRVREINIGPVMNGLHLFYGIGSLIAPIVLVASLSLTNKIKWGYWGLGFFSIIIVLQLINLPESEIVSPGDRKSTREGSQIPLTQTKYVGLIALFFFAFVGVEIGYGDWLVTYADQSGLADYQTAILLTSLYWGSFTIGRLISIPASLKINPKQILILDLGGCAGALVLMLIFRGSPVILWIGTMLLGISIASIFPTMLTFSESLLPLTGKITSRFFISGSIGSIILPWIIGRFVESRGSILILEVLSITMLMAVISFVILTKNLTQIPQNIPRDQDLNN